MMMGVNNLSILGSDNVTVRLEYVSYVAFVQLQYALGS